MLRRCFPELLPTFQVKRAIYTGRRVFPFKENVSKKSDNIITPGWGPILEERDIISEILKGNDYCTKGMFANIQVPTLIMAVTAIAALVITAQKGGGEHVFVLASAVLRLISLLPLLFLVWLDSDLATACTDTKQTNQ